MYIWESHWNIRKGDYWRWTIRRQRRVTLDWRGRGALERPDSGGEDQVGRRGGRHSGYIITMKWRPIENYISLLLKTGSVRRSLGSRARWRRRWWGHLYIEPWGQDYIGARSPGFKVSEEENLRINELSSVSGQNWRAWDDHWWWDGDRACWWRRRGRLRGWTPPRSSKNICNFELQRTCQMYYLSCVQVVMSPTCLEVQDLAWTVSLFTGNVHNITCNMQLSCRSIKLRDLDIWFRNKEILRVI